MSEDQAGARIEPEFRKKWRMIGRGMAVLALGVWIFHFYVWYRYVDTRPARPDPSQGRVYVLNNHGIYRYLTKQEDNLLTETTVIAFGLAVCSGLIRYFILGEKDKKPPALGEKTILS
jgi:hypothetical protein